MAYPTADPGDKMVVNFSVNNPGDMLTEQDILLTLENGAKSTVDQLTNISLNGGASGTYSLDWNIPEDQTVQIYELAIESEDDVEVIWDPLGVYDELNASGTTTLWENLGDGFNKNEAGLYATSERIYLGNLDSNNNQALFALSPDDGSQIWKSSVPTGYVSGIEYVDGVVYTGTYDGFMRAHNASDGSVIWENSDIPRVNALETTSDSVIVSTEQGSIGSFNRTDGTKQWETGVSSANNFASVTVGDGNAYATRRSPTDVSTIYVADLNDGSRGNDIDSPSIRNYRELQYSNGVIYGVSDSRQASALNVSDGSEIWFRTGLSDNNTYSMHLSTDVIYIGMQDETIMSLDRSDGSTVWGENLTINGDEEVSELSGYENVIVRAIERIRLESLRVE